MSIKGGGQAYPCAGLSGLPNDNFINPTEGMSLRDHFAGLAMQGLLANEDARLRTSTECARIAYEHADAALRAREAGQ
jgi:hypothetical protein